ncbi:elongation factor Ts, mitochondrial-like [Hydractinia symbiolongicarpus]|uniref:elongation factor Ts, mitochondrial-like n=1 Tax=Hydractinia symbiolongicarpus TaxID=13093 RepID=UPI00254DFDB8|nr:elongation factor Ts, mitochondrial-like [Hydractinia symbiolongicarpus]
MLAYHIRNYFGPKAIFFLPYRWCFLRQSSTNPGMKKALLTDLRKGTGYSFAKCNEALKQCNNNLQEAELWLHEQAEKEGWSKAKKLNKRSTNQGLVGILAEDNYVAIVELACETDFVARNELFQELVSTAAQSTLHFRQQVILQNQKVNSLNNNDVTHLREFLLQHELQTLTVKNGSVTLQEHLVSLVGKIGENMKLKRAIAIATNRENIVGTAVHGNITACINNCFMGSYASTVVLKPLHQDCDAINLKQLANGISQHVIGMNPQFLHPPHGNDNDEEALLSQEYLLNDKIKIKDIVRQNNVEIVDFVRYGVNE